MKKTIIAKNFRKLRSFKGLNQTEFADLFGITRSTVGSYEEGRAEPKLETLLKIADYFKLSVDDLIRKELTVNKIAGFDQPEPNRVEMNQLMGRMKEMNERMESMDASLQKLLKRE
ncbi:MAG: helix-turn-helix transcriptional regulator [Crocinitomicaceae bacterium]|nr:helix-turn-helix transcriptional regulator [Crocinitomicaceae bacterium]